MSDRSDAEPPVYRGEVGESAAEEDINPIIDVDSTSGGGQRGQKALQMVGRRHKRSILAGET
jgi:hypothetical protein